MWRVTVPTRRVMMIAPHFEEYALLLAVAMAKHVEVLLVLDVQALAREFEAREFPAHPQLRIVNNRFRSPADLARLLVELRRFRPDVLHWQEPSGLIKAAFASINITVANRFARTAITIHDPVPHSGRDARVAARLAPFRRYSRSRAHRLFLHGEACAAQYLTEYLMNDISDDRIRLTEHGVLLAATQTVAPPTAFRALMFGRMEAYKGLDVLLGALELLAAQGRPVGIEVAGSGPELDRLQDRLRHVGATVINQFVPAASLIARINAANCVLLPYTGASQSGVLAAAFANQRFVIGSKVGGIPDLVDDEENGLLVPPGNADMLAAAIDRAAHDPALRGRLSQGAARTAEARLGWDRIARRTLADY